MTLVMQNTAAAPVLPVTVRILREGEAFIAHATELDVSSHGRSVDDASRHLREALAAFLDEATRLGTLEDILQEAGYVRTPDGWSPPTVIAQDRVLVPLPS